MDKKNRPAKRRYRKQQGDYKIMSVSLSGAVFKKILKKSESDPEKNLSQFVEESVLSVMDDTEEIAPERKVYGSYPIKKSFTFTNGFIDKVKKRNYNFSFFIEEMLKKFLDKK